MGPEKGKDSRFKFKTKDTILRVVWRLWHAFKKKKIYYTSLLAIQPRRIHTHKHTVMHAWNMLQDSSCVVVVFGLRCAKLYTKCTHIFWMNHSILMKCSRVSLILMPRNCFMIHKIDTKWDALQCKRSFWCPSPIHTHTHERAPHQTHHTQLAPFGWTARSFAAADEHCYMRDRTQRARNDLKPTLKRSLRLLRKLKNRIFDVKEWKYLN